MKKYSNELKRNRLLFFLVNTSILGKCVENHFVNLNT